MVLLLILLSACNTEYIKSNNKTETNYYLSLGDEGDNWEIDGYEIMMTPEGYKAGNGILKRKGEDKEIEGFLSYDVYADVGGEKNRFHGGSVSEDTNITELATGTIDSEEENLKEFPQIDEIYMTVTWNDDGTDGDQKEKIILYDKNKNNEPFVDIE